MLAPAPRARPAGVSSKARRTTRSVWSAALSRRSCTATGRASVVHRLPRFTGAAHGCTKAVATPHSKRFA
jgi:hypothetical protein